MRSVLRASIKRTGLALRRILLNIVVALMRLRRATADQAPSRLRGILFIRVDRIGDMMLSTPALRAIKAAFPGAELTVLASFSNAPLLRYDPHVDRVITWEAPSWKGSPLRALRGARALAHGGYDAVIDPTTGYDLAPALLAGFSCAPIRVGFPGHGREVFFNRLCPLREDRHVVDLALAAAQRLGAGPGDRRPHLHLLPAERHWAQRWLAGARLESCPVVAVHPGAHYPSQRWPVDYYARLVHDLAAEHGYGVLLLGGPADRGLTERIRATAGVEMAGFVSPELRRVSALISCADVLVCNNSGPLHIAAALDVPTISFMGPTEKSRWTPIGPGHIVLRQDRLDCIGCNRGRCDRRGHACMRSITPETVVSYVLQQVGARRIAHGDRAAGGSSV